MPAKGRPWLGFRDHFLGWMALFGVQRLAFSVHAPWYLSFLLALGGGVAVLIGFVAYAVAWPHLPQRERPLPRWAYALLACGWLGAAEGCRSVGLRLPQSSWQSNAWGFTMFACALIALVMIGRAAAWGRVRQLFWLKPPASV